MNENIRLSTSVIRSAVGEVKPVWICLYRSSGLILLSGEHQDTEETSRKQFWDCRDSVEMCMCRAVREYLELSPQLKLVSGFVVRQYANSKVPAGQCLYNSCFRPDENCIYRKLLKILDTKSR